jgi:O-antigen/teichoic acid export membrane protein
MRRRLPDILMILLLFALPLVMFWQQTLGGRTLLPTENIFQFEPFYTYREVARAPEVPHNMLVSDLVLENFQWKSFIRQSIDQREIPLWNAHQFAGIPFLAAGQQSTLYPVSLLYYVLPLPVAYGWYTVVNLWLAGVFMYAFGRGLGISRTGSALAGIVYQLSGFFIASVVFQMIIGAAAWLPLLLLMVEFIIRQQPALRGRPASLPWVVIGAVGLGFSILAGHVEITYYTLIILAYYAAARLGWELFKNRDFVGTRRALSLRWLFVRSIWLIIMIALGLGIGAVQFVPLYELAQTNWRAERSSLETVLGYAHPLRDVVQFVMPNFYGSPAHHHIFDVFSLQNVPVDFINPDGFHKTNTEWGIKNYVEGALYLGILPLALAVYGLFIKSPPQPLPMHGEGRRGGENPPYRIIFTILTLISLTFMFGLPTYAALFYGFPGMNQLNSPFRWIFAVTLCVAVLAGFGLDGLQVRTPNPSPSDGEGRRGGENKWTRRIGMAFIILGIVTLAGLLVSRLLYPQIEPLVERVFTGMAKATEAFPDARAFYSYQFSNILIFGAMLVGTGMVFVLSRGDLLGRPYSADNSVGEGLRPSPTMKIPLWQTLALALTAVDLIIASWGFNPASDPALLDFTPPAIEWLLNQPGEWRYTTLDDPNQRPLMQANLGWRYGLDDIRGYESIIPAQYVDYMRRVAPQNQLDFNRVAPLYTTDAGEIDWGRLAWLNVRYVITHKNTNLYDYVDAPLDARSGNALPVPGPLYEDEAVRIWHLPYDTAPRAYVAQLLPDQNETLNFDEGFSYGWDVVIDSDTGREKILHANISPQVETSWLVVSESYFPGWRAFVRPRGGEDNLEKPFEVELVLENFQGVNLSPEAVKAAFADVYHALPEDQRTALDNGQVTIRMVYSPASFQIGLFGSFISGIVILFMLGVWLWRLYVARDEGQSGVAVIARNSLAPIILNLFNRAIDFAFAFIMLRVLGPEGSGVYQYAVVIFVWFDIFTNFGLNVFLTREVSRDRSQAWRYFFNTSILRIALVGVGVLLLAGFIGARQSFINPELTASAILTLILLYIGLLPGSLSTGMSAVFYAFEKAEVPAAISTVSTISKTVLGVIVLLLGYGAVGLAGVSIVTNVITLAIMLYVGREFLRIGDGAGRGDLLGRPYNPDAGMIRGMVGESWPLMLNHFLATIFFQIDVVIIEAVHGARMVGQYGVAYKWVSALNVIPAFFTMALLPAMSRMAREDRPALKRNYQLAIKLLVSTALPIAVLFTFLAYFLTGVLGGAEFLPDGAIATQLMIWSIPIGWINSLTQYVLIALDLQRHITRAFIVAVSFNIVSNLILIPQFGYRAAALTTIASELVLLIPFALLLHRALGALTWREILWKPVLATLVMVGVMTLLWPISAVGAALLAVIVYIGVLAALHPLSPEEMQRLSPLIPARFRRLAQS